MRSHNRVATERTLTQDRRAVVFWAALLVAATTVVFGQAVVTKFAADLDATTPPLPLTRSR